MTPQERQQAFAQAYNQAVAVLQQQYGFTVEARLSVDGNGNLAMVKAVLEVVPMAGWQSPLENQIPEMEIDTPGD